MHKNYQIRHQPYSYNLFGRRLILCTFLIFFSLTSACNVSNDATNEHRLEFKDSGPWINSEPFALSDKTGEVVLVDFWTYTCVNCLRTLPYLKDWHRKYVERGLTIVGVHSPEFDFEKVFQNVDSAVSQLGIEHAVFLDNEKETWRGFNNRYWPAKYLIDHEGIIRYQHFGEGDYAQTEHAIRKQLERAGFDLSDIPARTVGLDGPFDQLDSRKYQTRELYAGTDRNYLAYRNHINFRQGHPYIGNKEYFLSSDSSIMEEPVAFMDPGDYEDNMFYINGLWTKKSEYLSHARVTDDHSDYLVLKFSGAEVNVVLEEGYEIYRVRIYINDMPLTRYEAGVDIQFDEKGHSFVEVDQSRMFNIVKLRRSESRILKLSSNSSDFSVYAFTFGSEPRDD